MKIRLNVDLNSYKKGQVIDVNSENGIPTDIYWRKRLREAKIDNCIEVIKKQVKREVSKVVKEAVVSSKNLSEVRNDNNK